MPTGSIPARSEAIEELKVLLPFNITFVELPLPRERIGGLAGIKKQLLMADESIFTPQ
jgi:hypothetical protein